MYCRRQSPQLQRTKAQARACWPALLVALVAVVPTVARGAGEEEPAPSEADVRAKERLEAMREVIDDFQVRPSETESEELKFSPRPLLRYNDQSRDGDNGTLGVLDGTVWRLGESGRPRALVALEIYLRRQGGHLLNCEFVSLSARPFEMTSPRGPRWRPSSTDLAMTPLADAAAPAESAKSRLAQMRQLSRRFTVQEELRGEKTECRLLAQPIDRYDDVALGILDGAIFVFANGTNPEMGLIVECAEGQWSYGVIRLTGARLFAQLDGRLFLDSPKPANGVDAPNSVASHAITLRE